MGIRQGQCPGATESRLIDCVNVLLSPSWWPKNKWIRHCEVVPRCMIPLPDWRATRAHGTTHSLPYRCLGAAGHRLTTRQQNTIPDHLTVSRWLLSRRPSCLLKHVGRVFSLIDRLNCHVADEVDPIDWPILDKHVQIRPADTFFRRISVWPSALSGIIVPEPVVAETVFLIEVL